MRCFGVARQQLSIAITRNVFLASILVIRRYAGTFQLLKTTISGSNARTLAVRTLSIVRRSESKTIWYPGKLTVIKRRLRWGKWLIAYKQLYAVTTCELFQTSIKIS